MRPLMFFFIASFVLPAFGADELEDCADIESAVERLDCYDRLARERARSVEPTEPDQSEIVPAVREAERKPLESSAGEVPPSGVDEVDESGARAALFGRETQQKSVGVGEVDHIEARIVSVRQAPLGQQIVTLSNGQVWMENEPGRRRIAPDQAVTIRKRRWHYEMELPSQPDIAVRRIE